MGGEKSSEWRVCQRCNKGRQEGKKKDAHQSVGARRRRRRKRSDAEEVRRAIEFCIAIRDARLGCEPRSRAPLRDSSWRLISSKELITSDSREVRLCSSYALLSSEIECAAIPFDRNLRRRSCRGLVHKHLTPLRLSLKLMPALRLPIPSRPITGQQRHRARPHKESGGGGCRST